MEGFTEKVYIYESMQQCIASESFSISSKHALLPVESASDSLEGTSSVSPTDSSTHKVYEAIQQCIASDSFNLSSKLQSRLRQHSVYVRF